MKKFLLSAVALFTVALSVNADDTWDYVSFSSEIKLQMDGQE